MSDEPVKQEPKIDGSSEQPNQDGTKAPEVTEELSKVASSPKRNIAVLVSMILGFSVIAYNLLAPQLFGDDKKKNNFEEAVSTPTSVAKPAEAKSEAPPIPQLPEPPKLVAPTPLPSAIPELPTETKTEAAPPTTVAAPASVSGPSVLPSELLGNSEEAKKRKEAKRKSSVVLVGGVQPSHKTQAEIEQTVDFKKRGDLSCVLGKGKILEATTESAINTDFGGEIRAMISRDVFSENGKVILIPKGSRVFGTYQATMDGAYGRVSVVWNRIDLMSGYTLTLSGDAVDNLGRKGVQGRVDNKYAERMANVALMSAFNVAVAAGIDKIVPPVANSQATATNTAIATNMQSTALAAYNAGAKDTMENETITITSICTTTQAVITDKTSPAFTQLQQACTNALTVVVGAVPGQRSTALMNTINTVAAGLLTTAATSSTPTQKQTAAKQAFTDISTAAKDMVKTTELKPNITIDQGHQIKIYVNKDYLFPRDAVMKSKVLQ